MSFSKLDRVATAQRRHVLSDRIVALMLAVGMTVVASALYLV